MTKSDTAIAQLHAIVDAWEALPGGRQVRNSDVERWLAEHMGPGIDAIRGFLRRPRPDGVLPPPPQTNVVGVTLSAEQVIAIRDALIADDVVEAYHQLYQAVDPQFCRYEPWADTEAQLRRSPPETPTPPGNQIRTAECDGKDAVPVTGQLPVGTASPQSPAPPLTWLIAKRGGLEAVTQYVTYRAASLASDYAILEIDGKRVLQDFTSVEAACRAAFADHTLRSARAALAITEGEKNG